MSSKPPNNMSKLPALPADAPALASGRDDTTSHVSKACPMARWSQSSVSSGASSASTALMTPGASSSSSSDHLPSVPPLDANALGCGSLDCITEEDGSATAVAAPSGATVDPYGVGPHRTPTATTPTPTPAPTSASPDQQLITALENLSTDRGRQDSRAAPARHALRTGTDRQQRSAGLGFDRELAALEGIVEQLDPTSISSDEGSGSGSGSGSIRSKASPPILAQDKNLGITIYDLTAQISMPVSRSSSWSGVSRTSEVEEDARRPAWAKPVVEQDNIGGNLEQVIIQGLEIQQDFGEGVFHLEPDTDITATPDLTQHALKGSDGRIMVKTDDKQHVVCCWLPGIPQECCMISTGVESITIQANSHDRGEHFFWRVQMLDADFDSELSANWIGSDILRVAVVRSEAKARLVEKALGNKVWPGQRFDLHIDIKGYIDPIGSKRTEDQLFA